MIPAPLIIMLLPLVVLFVWGIAFWAQRDERRVQRQWERGEGPWKNVRR